MAKKVSQTELRQMMQKMKAEKPVAKNSKMKKYKLSSREVALIEEEKKRKREDELEERRKVARSAGVPDNFFDSAKTKAFLNLNKAPKKSILKNNAAAAAAMPKPGANSKATGHEWTSSGPMINKSLASEGGSSTKSKTSASFKTPSGGTIVHLQEEAQENQLPSDFFDDGKKKTEDAAGPGSEENGEDDTKLPEGFFDDPIMDAKARGIEYKNPEDEEWEAFKKEIAVEVAVSQDLQAEGELEETTERQLEEIEEQMQAWSRVRDIEIKKDVVDEKLKSKKPTENGDDSGDELELELEQMDEFLDWRLKKS